MTLTDVIEQLGVKQHQIVETCNFGSIERFENGYSAKTQDIKTGDKLQVVTISKNIDWTDGTCRPAYGSVDKEVYIYLNERVELTNYLVLPQ